MNLFAASSQDGPARYKILDFGISKLLGDAAQLTRDQILGTPAYMAPEQILGQEVDPRTDVYALGVIAYRVLTGRPAFRGPEPNAIYQAVLSSTPEEPSWVAELPPAVDAVLALAMAKQREDRFDDAPTFVDALARALDGNVDPALESRADKALASKVS